MPEKPPDNQQQIWAQLLGAVQEKVPTQAFETWFPPVVFNGISDDTLVLTVPNEAFRQALLENYASLLESVLAHIFPNRRMMLSVRTCEITSTESSALPVVPASQLEPDVENQPWLIERIWSINAVGFVSGPPKSYKTWTVLEIAVSVASGTPCLGSFAVHHSGPVLLYAAEDPMPALRRRLESLAGSHGLTLDQVDIRVIRADSLRLDRSADREKLAATVDLHRPALLILDPLIRLHALDENQAGSMAELLGHLRALQRSSGTAIAIVHHHRKNSAHSAGQSLRGSSDLYAFVDSLVSLQRRHGRIVLSAEHRSAPALSPLPLELIEADQPDRAPSLRIAYAPPEDPPTENPLEERIIEFLKEPLSQRTADSMRAALHVRKQRLLEALRSLAGRGLIRRDANRYALTPNGGEPEIK